ncbi:MAG: large conductance mechanosensitive channel protein MscL [Actinobacteria bacterium]|nr:large conductance mechanosensitive channel protein MscL [Actinomycetota bacterium]
MLQGFKEFVLRGNIVDLAVAVVIGSAFVAVVDTVVTSLISPILAWLGGAQVDRLGFQLGASGNAATLIDLGAMINAAIVFVITAAVVYFVFVLPMNKLSELRAAGEEEEPEAPTEDVIVLREIRDLLAARDNRP